MQRCRLQEVVNSGIQSIVLRVGATNVDDSLAAQSAIALGRQGSKPSGATITKSQVPVPAPCSHASTANCMHICLHLPPHARALVVKLHDQASLDMMHVKGIFSAIGDLYIVTIDNFLPLTYTIWLSSQHVSALSSQVAQVVAQALQQADTDVAIEAWAVRDAEPRDLAQLMAEVSLLSSACTSCCHDAACPLMQCSRNQLECTADDVKMTQARSVQSSNLCCDPL